MQGVKLPEELAATTDLEAVVKHAEVLPQPAGSQVFLRTGDTPLRTYIPACTFTEGSRLAPPLITTEANTILQP